MRRGPLVLHLLVWGRRELPLRPVLGLLVWERLERVLRLLVWVRRELVLVLRLLA